MWYTTNFEWRFNLSRELNEEEYQTLLGMADYDKSLYPPTAPDSYNQREPTEDYKWIERNWGEKFYNYVEWLNRIKDNLLKTWGIEISWEVLYQGESMEDNGIIAKDEEWNFYCKEAVILSLCECPECWARFDSSRYQVEDDDEDE